MKCSESWLREWVNPSVDKEALGQKLTMAGLEVEEIAPVALSFNGVVVGEVTKVEKHPDGDKLRVCEVNVNGALALSIVCGAANVKPGMKVPVALMGAELPNDKVIKPATLRGFASQGMLCSASELGISEESQGLLELPADAPIGTDLRKYLALDDFIIDVSITPNRGDCLSVQGLAREVSALTQTPMTPPRIEPVAAVNQETIPVKVVEKSGCPRYVGRVIRNVKANLVTPEWLQQRLRRSGVRSISPVVDVTNYVMLELGQPMHAFDLATIAQGIQVRQSVRGEKIRLLDGSDKELDAETVVIADTDRPLAIAGVMGGLDSSVTLLTRDIFLESAYFSPRAVARQRQFYKLTSDSAYRFERGVDPTLQRIAIERATQLIVSLVGGEPGPVIEVRSDTDLPKESIISLPTGKIKKVLGFTISDHDIKTILSALSMPFQHERDNWLVTVPPYRSDLLIAEDIIEEIARLYGYDKIPTHALKGELAVRYRLETDQDWQGLRQGFRDLSFNEIISYSFIDKKMQRILDPGATPRELVNPMTAEMSVMRTNLWAGLINAMLYNKSRQQNRTRLFEIGACFVTRDNDVTVQEPRLSGLISGLATPEQWGMPSREVDFFDLKGHLETILSINCSQRKFIFKPESHSALHPGQTAGIYHEDKKVGILGALHPGVLDAIDVSANVFVFEIDLALLQPAPPSQSREISKFPEIRRDIAILVNQAIPASEIQDKIRMYAGDWLKDVFIFDVYQGKGISPGLKSVALALILQHPARTLVDEEVTEIMNSVIKTLKGQLGAELRS